MQLHTPTGELYPWDCLLDAFEARLAVAKAFAAEVADDAALRCRSADGRTELALASAIEHIAEDFRELDRALRVAVPEQFGRAEVAP